MRVRPMTRTFALLLAGAFAFVGCNFEVSNPGPVQDPNVNLPGAHASLVNGAVRAVQNAIGNLYVGENIVHGITPSGHTGVGGTTVEEEMGILTDENNGDNDETLGGHEHLTSYGALMARGYRRNRSAQPRRTRRIGHEGHEVDATKNTREMPRRHEDHDG